MKIVIYIVLAAAVAAAAAGWGHLAKVAAKNKREMAQYVGEEEKVTANFGKTLVIYYSLTGHTRAIAEKIAVKTGADVYEIKTKEKLNGKPWFYLTLKKQLKDKKYPELAGYMPDLSVYDTVFVGAPVWWYTMATPLYAFLQQADFAGKKVVPFSTQGSNVGTYFADFADKARHAEILPGASFNNLPAEYAEAEDNKVSRWLNSIGGVAE